MKTYSVQSNCLPAGKFCKANTVSMSWDNEVDSTPILAKAEALAAKMRLMYPDTQYIVVCEDE